VGLGMLLYIVFLEDEKGRARMINKHVNLKRVGMYHNT
jgi:hypothetical protein